MTHEASALAEFNAPAVHKPKTLFSSSRPVTQPDEELAIALGSAEQPQSKSPAQYPADEPAAPADPSQTGVDGEPGIDADIVLHKGRSVDHVFEKFCALESADSGGIAE